MNAILAALVNGAVLGGMLTAAVWAVLRLIPRRTLNAATRYVVWWLAVAIVIALPAIYLPIPSFRAAPPPAPRSAPVIPAPTPAVIAITVAVPFESAPPTAEAAPNPFPVRITATQWPRYILLAWASAGLLLLARLALSSILLARASARAADAPAPLRAQLARWLALSGASRRHVRLAASIEIAVPVAVGPHRPSILIPARLLETLDPAELDQIGLHEAAHLARRDDYALLFQRILEAVFALHPVVRYIARQIDLEREIACDDLVIHATGHPRSYATCLTRVVELTGGMRSSLAATGRTAGASHLSLRVESLLDKTRHTGTRLLKARLTAMAAVIVALAWAAGHSPRFVAFASPLVPRIPLRHILATAFSPAPAPAPQQPQDVDGRIVEDSSGNPLASAELRFHKAGQLELAANLETDRDGRFNAAGLPPGEYTVDLAKPNYITATLRLRAPSAGLLFRLVRYGVIDGIAADDTGARLPARILGPGGRTGGSSRIAIFTKTPGSDALQRLREVPMQEGGRFRIFDLPPGNYAIGLFYSGLPIGSGMQLYPDNAHPRIFAVTGGEEYREINFMVSPRPAWQVSGKIDRPSANAPFALALSLPDQPALPIAQALSEEDGSFRFEKIPAGTYDLFVGGPTGGYTAYESILGRAGDPLFGRTRVQVSGQDVAGVTVALSPGRSFNVILHSASGGVGCPQTASVFPTALEPWGLLFQANAQANFTKEVALSGLPPGRFRVAATLTGNTCYQANQPEVDLASAQSGPITIELAPAGAIRGTLRSGAASSAGFVVVLLGPAAQTQLAFPDTQGRFAFDGLRPGSYRVAAQPNSAAAGAKTRWVSDLSRMTAVEVPGGAATSIELPVIPAKGDRQ